MYKGLHVAASDGWAEEQRGASGKQSGLEPGHEASQCEW